MLGNTNTKQFYPGPILNNTLEITKFLFRDVAQIYVVKTTTDDEGNLIDEALAYGTDYEVTKVLPDDISVEDTRLIASTGQVILKSHIEVKGGEQLTVYRKSDLIQDTNYPRAGSFPAASHEGALDYLTMQNQEQQESINRALLAPVTLKDFNGELPIPKGDNVFKWNADGTAVENYDIIGENKQFQEEVTEENTETRRLANQALQTANEAKQNSTQAVGTANNAENLANQALSTAQNAQANSQAAVQTANSASQTAQHASTVADSAITIASEAMDEVVELKENVANFEKNINETLGDVLEAAGKINELEEAVEDTKEAATIAKQAAESAAKSAQQTMEALDTKANVDMDNLSEAGIDFVNNSKALETGAVSDNVLIYKDVKKYKGLVDSSGIDVIKPNEYEAVGSLIISDEGIASSFSTTNSGHDNINYIKIKGIDYAKDFQIQFRMNIEGYSHYDRFLGFGDISQYVNELYLNTNKRIAMIINSTETNTAQNIYNENTWYDFIFEKKDTDYTLKMKEINNNTYSTIITKTVDYNIPQSSVITVGNAGAQGALVGSIDLNAFKIYVDGNLVYQACLKIPYTLSKTGSRIVDAEYRDRVQDMYEQFGYTPYYTIDEENQNFSLPAGEIYGYIGKVDQALKGDIAELNTWMNSLSATVQQLMQDLAPNQFIVTSNKRKLIMKTNTIIPLDVASTGQRLWYVNLVDTGFSPESLLDSGSSFTTGKDYSIYLVPTSDNKNVELKVSLNKTAPSGYNPLDVRRIGGFHTLCVDAGDITWHSNHPLSGYIAGDILPQSVWALYHRPYSSPSGMIYIPSAIPFWRDIYDHSGTLATSVSEYGATVTRNRDFYGHAQDMLLSGKCLPNYQQAAISGYGCEPLKAILGKAEASITIAGGHLNESNHRIISIYGAEDCVGCTWKYTDQLGCTGGSKWAVSPSVSNIYQYGAIYILLVGGHWAHSGYAGPFATPGDASALTASSARASFGVSYPLPRKSVGIVS